ncbi:MAG: dihydrofolate reductase [Bacteroidetes bacterium]|nr:dihydrofolate reductase [Bacteroidota bacterium]
MFSIIVAIAENLAIGKDNDLLWHIPGDLRRFKQITVGHTVIMGKRTYYSLPRRPLPDRRSLVITDIPGEIIEGCIMAYSIEDAVAKCNPSEENFIIGGASVYRQFLAIANRLYLTRVNKPFEGDVFFPEIDYSKWKLVSKEDFPLDEGLGFAFSYENYERKE